jgi:DNA processing protein
MPDVPDAIRDHLALSLIPGLGPKLTAALLERFGNATAARQATAAQLVEIPHIGEKTAAELAAALRTVNIEPELALLERHNTQVMPLGFGGYPSPLAKVPAPPPLLYVRGEWLNSDANAVGIVGSRSCTQYGLKIAAQLARELARAGFTIVSGLARGIDGAAHRAALEAGGRTVAALAGGLSKIYPPEHADLAGQIAAGRGSLITETPMGMDPQPGMFPARNRIISGLSRAVIVVEANARSGALITARHAAEQGREVYAVPGRVDDPASAGCLELLRSGARLVRSADDVIEDLKGISAVGYSDLASGRRQPTVPKIAKEQPTDVGRSPEPAPAPAPTLDPLQQRVFDAVATRKHADELTRELTLSVADLTRTLMQLEMKKLVRRQPGNFYERR